MIVSRCGLFMIVWFLVCLSWLMRSATCVRGAAHAQCLVGPPVRAV